jgi:hypothetical protein
MLDKVKTANYLGSQVFAQCSIGTAGGTCTITTGKSVTRTVGLSLGASRDWAAGQLSISSANTVSTSVSCTSPPLPAGGVWRAKARGDRFTYKIRKQTWIGQILYSTETSGTQSSFNPYPTNIHCH